MALTLSPLCQVHLTKVGTGAACRPDGGAGNCCRGQCNATGAGFQCATVCAASGAACSATTPCSAGGCTNGTCAQVVVDAGVVGLSYLHDLLSRYGLARGERSEGP